MNELQKIVELLNGYSTDDISYHVNYAVNDNNLWNITVKAYYNIVSEKLPSILDIVERLEGYRGNGNWKLQEVKKTSSNDIAHNLGLYSIMLKYIGGNNEEKN